MVIGSYKLKNNKGLEFPFHSLTQLSPNDLAINRYHRCADGAHKVLLAALLELDLGYFKADTHH